jgi:hypothetical protein
MLKRFEKKHSPAKPKMLTDKDVQGMYSHFLLFTSKLFKDVSLEGVPEETRLQLSSSQLSRLDIPVAQDDENPVVEKSTEQDVEVEAPIEEESFLTTEQSRHEGVAPVIEAEITAVVEDAADVTSNVEQNVNVDQDDVVSMDITDDIDIESTDEVQQQGDEEPLARHTQTITTLPGN